VLSGKYLNNARPEGSRLQLFPEYERYVRNPNAIKATEAYIHIAKRHNLDPAQMALAYVNSRPFLSSNIIGATTMAQLQANIASIDVTLDEAVLEEIEAIHQLYPNPCP
jgi:aryl-alcohol dehydrogenase-like predicted oxidoreductase